MCPERDGVRPFTNKEVPMDILKTSEAVSEGFEVPEMDNMIDFYEQRAERTIQGLNEIPERSSERTDVSDQATRGSSRDLRESTAGTIGETTEDEAGGSSDQATRESIGNTREGTTETTNNPGPTTEEEAGASDTVLGKRPRSPENRARRQRRASGTGHAIEDGENRPRPQVRGSGSTDNITRSQLGYSPLTAPGSVQSRVTDSGAGQTETTTASRSETPAWEEPPYQGERKTGLPDLRECKCTK